MLDCLGPLPTIPHPSNALSSLANVSLLLTHMIINTRSPDMIPNLPGSLIEKNFHMSRSHVTTISSHHATSNSEHVTTNINTQVTSAKITAPSQQGSTSDQKISITLISLRNNHHHHLLLVTSSLTF